MLTKEEVERLANAHAFTSRRGTRFVAISEADYSNLCEMAIGYLDVMPRPIEEAPKDGTFFYGWHRVWNCWIAVKKYENSWIEKTLCTQWPYDAFTHFIPLSSLPKVKHD